MPYHPEVIDDFKQYFTEAVGDKILRETNRYAEQYIQANITTLSSRYIVQKWKLRNSFFCLCIIIRIIYNPMV